MTANVGRVSTISQLDRTPENIGPGCEFVWLDEVGSTQDEAKSRAPLAEDTLVRGIAARYQTNGRGTHGRDWLGAPGNLFLTVSLPITRVPVTLTLLPLKVGIEVARAVEWLLDEAPKQPDSPCGKVTLKWPNDVLLDDKKLAGVLIEGDGTYLHVGIGINVGAAPDIPDDGPQRGRPSAWLADCGVDASQGLVQGLGKAITVARDPPGRQLSAPLGCFSGALRCRPLSGATKPGVTATQLARYHVQRTMLGHSLALCDVSEALLLGAAPGRSRTL